MFNLALSFTNVQKNVTSTLIPICVLIASMYAKWIPLIGVINGIWSKDGVIWFLTWTTKCFYSKDMFEKIRFTFAVCEKYFLSTCAWCVLYDYLWVIGVWNIEANISFEKLYWFLSLHFTGLSSRLLMNTV